ncbi:STM3941 family protein [uncultured Algibacter sp.]|uniref:STM3941 family protein n=1 Tax=uncultured Algibacter sp. TaxID=298659 RepID=UPI003216AAC9
MTEINIPLNKLKIILLSIVSLAFVIFGAFMSIKPEIFASARYPKNVIFIVGIVAVIFFGITTFFIFKKTISKEPRLIINDMGIIDNSNAINLGLITWEDITGVKLIKVNSNKFVIIEIHNPEKYIERCKNAILKKAIKANQRVYGSPLSITLHSLKIKPLELVSLIDKQIEERKK